MTNKQEITCNTIRWKHLDLTQTWPNSGGKLEKNNLDSSKLLSVIKRYYVNRAKNSQ